MSQDSIKELCDTVTNITDYRYDENGKLIFNDLVDHPDPLMDRAFEMFCTELTPVQRLRWLKLNPDAADETLADHTAFANDNIWVEDSFNAFATREMMKKLIAGDY